MKLLFPLLVCGSLGAGAFFLLPAGGMTRKERTFGDPVSLCKLTPSFIGESSGVAPSRITRGIYYTHNDSGDTARFFKFNLSGQVLSAHGLTGAGAVDWEDMASARFQGRSYLYFGDVGDNLRVRSTIKVYRCEEPTGTGNVTQFDTYTLKYPDGPRNCETLMVHPRTGEIWIVSKVDSGASSVYRLPAPSGSGTYDLIKVGQVTVGSAIPGSQMTTGGDISADGKYVVVRTYTAAFEFEAPKSFTGWIHSAPKRVTLAIETQGEAACYSPDGKTLVTTSEGSPCPVNGVPISGPR